jgi:hypothetical protein
MTDVAPRSSHSLPASSPRKGVRWFAFMVGMWVALALVAVSRAETLDDIWSWVRDLPLVIEGIVWLLFLPWVLGLAVWESSWDGWLRLLIVSSIAIGWSVVSLPRKTRPGVGNEATKLHRRGRMIRRSHEYTRI